ncbi:aminotransferase class V-fold PLP-dependent enzyme, partial [Acidobacteria bacterium AH-259-L09]|nr:aminotransferase class V-fold PLP-dependent enzyme [Acidobacteria bacterium AH-259-L09]
SNSLGAMPRSVYASLQEYADTWASRGVRAWEEEWWEMPVSVGDLIAKIIGADPGQVSMHPNVTLAEAIVFSSLEVSPKRNKIVYSELNFPSIRYFYQAQPDVEIHVVPCPDGMSVPLEELLDAIDERTLAVPISHVVYKSSFLQDVHAVIEKAHSMGAFVILDTYQSCGAVPFNVKELHADFVIGGSVKWLCGGPGVAYLYVCPELSQKLEPKLTGWLAHQRPFAFEPEMEYVDSAFRFLNGTPNIPGLYAARCGYEIIAQVGMERIREKSLRLTQRILELADEFGFRVNTPRDPAHRGGAVAVTPPNAPGVGRELLRRNFIVDFRPGAGIRIAPHFYNTMQEVIELMTQMKRIVDEGTG